MSQRLARSAIWVAMSGVGLLLGLAIAYFVRGSLEEFPTDAQTDKVRLVTAVAAAVLVLVEVGLWRLLRGLERGRGSHRRAIDGGAPPAPRGRRRISQ